MNFNYNNNNLNTESAEILLSKRQIDNFISKRIVSETKFESEILDFYLPSDYSTMKNIILINKLANNPTEQILNEIKTIGDNLFSKTFKDKNHNLNEFDYQFIYNPQSFEIIKTTLNSKLCTIKTDIFFCFINLAKELIEETVDIVISKILTCKESNNEIISKEKEELKAKLLNPKILFSYLEIMGITSNDKIIGVVRNKACFTIDLKTKEFKAREIIYLDNNNSLVFSNLLNQKNPKIEIEVEINNTNNIITDKASNKKLFYYIVEETYSDSLKFFTKNIFEEKNKVESFKLDSRLPRIYFSNVLNEHINCFFVCLDKSNYKLYCELNNQEFNEKENLFLIYVLESKIVKLSFNFEKNILDFYSEVLKKKEQTVNITPRNNYSNQKNYENFVFFLNEDFQIIIYNFFTDEFKVIKEYI